jgi:hypothetical protein
MSRKREGRKERAKAVRMEEVILRHGIKLKRMGAELVGPCPKCGGEDRFAINTVKQVFNCRGCGAAGDVIALVQHLDGSGFEEAMTTLTGEEPEAKPNGGNDAHKANGKAYTKSDCEKENEETYDYEDENGELVFSVQRIVYRKPDGTLLLDKHGKPHKEFYPYRPYPDEANVWIIGINAGEYIRRGPRQNWWSYTEDRRDRFGPSQERRIFSAVALSPPYRLPELLAALEADPNAEVHIFEGERKVDVARNWHLVATCCNGGAGKWKAEHSEHLRGRNVVIHPDNDDKGRKHVETTAQSLHGIARRIRVLELPGLGPTGDIVDWKKVGHTREELEALIENAREWKADSSKLVEMPPAAPATTQLPPVLSKAQFLNGFVPPDYRIDGMLQRGFIYSLTGQTGAGKTAVALRINEEVGSPDPGPGMFGGHEVLRGCGVYFVGENPDDIRMRIIGSDSKRGRTSDHDRIDFIPGVFDIDGLFAQLEKVIADRGGVDFVTVDTSAAYFPGQDENSNAEIGAHARKLRRLTTLPGKPTVLVLCHPIKHVTEAYQLLPRGGGAFLAEMDGNLTLFGTGHRISELHHSNKFRGPGFEPISFRLEEVSTPKLVDARGRLIPTVRAVEISEAEENAQAEQSLNDDNRVLAAMSSSPSNTSIADLCRKLGWISDDGLPHKSKLHRVLARLEKANPKLVRNDRGKWILTEAGKNAAAAALEARIDLRSPPK